MDELACRTHEHTVFAVDLADLSTSVLLAGLVGCLLRATRVALDALQFAALPNGGVDQSRAFCAVAESGVLTGNRLDFVNVLHDVLLRKIAAALEARLG